MSKGSFLPVDGAPVPAGVKQTALDVGCGSARWQGVGNGWKNGLGVPDVGGRRVAVAGPGSDFSEASTLGLESAALDPVAAPACPPGPVTVTL